MFDRASEKVETSGLRSPGKPPEGSDTHGIANFYLNFYENEIARARTVVKGRARGAVLAVAILGALTGVLGAATAAFQAPVLGVASAAAAGSIAVITAWDDLFRHRGLWAQRSRILHALQALRREFEMRTASGDDRNQIGQDTMSQLNKILAQDFALWSVVNSGKKNREAKQ